MVQVLLVTPPMLFNLFNYKENTTQYDNHIFIITFLERFERWVLVMVFLVALNVLSFVFYFTKFSICLIDELNVEIW